MSLCKPIMLSRHERDKLPFALRNEKLYAVRDLGGYVEVTDQLGISKTTIDKDRAVFLTQVCDLCRKPRGYCDACPVKAMG